MESGIFLEIIILFLFQSPTSCLEANIGFPFKACASVAARSPYSKEIIMVPLVLLTM